ncbi:DNA cytosine methyltransferase, partial [Streptococcus suis]
AVNSNSQLYKQAGNSVTVNVIEAIARKLEETDE